MALKPNKPTLPGADKVVVVLVSPRVVEIERQRVVDGVQPQRA